MKGLFAMSALLLALGAAADDYPLDKHMYVACAATHALLVSKLEKGSFQDSVADEASRFAALAGDTSLVQKVLTTMEQRYDDGDMTWSEVVAMSQQCSANYKPQVARLEH